MSSRNVLPPLLMACALAVALLDIVPMANAASAAPSLLNSGESADRTVVEIKYRGRRPRLYPPIAPSYLYYDYPYYYSRGHYPTHIEPGFIYYGYPYAYYKSDRYLKYRSQRTRRNY